MITRPEAISRIDVQLTYDIKTQKEGQESVLGLLLQQVQLFRDEVKQLSQGRAPIVNLLRHARRLDLGILTQLTDVSRPQHPDACPCLFLKRCHRWAGLEATAISAGEAWSDGA